MNSDGPVLHVTSSWLSPLWCSSEQRPSIVKRYMSVMPLKKTMRRFISNCSAALARLREAILASEQLVNSSALPTPGNTIYNINNASHSIRVLEFGSMFISYEYCRCSSGLAGIPDSLLEISAEPSVPSCWSAGTYGKKLAAAVVGA